MFEEKWPMKAAKSKKLYDQALKYLPYGVSSMTQGRPVWRPHPIYIERGYGSKIYDVDGNSYIDHWLAAGPLILGHAPVKVIEAVKQQLDKGTTYSAGTALMVDVAKKISRLVPCAEKVRFCSSGTEAVLNAIRVARAYTGRDKILKFEGQYHGWHDSVFVSYNPPSSTLGMEGAPHKVPSSAGIPQNVLDNVIVATWNNYELLEKIVKDHANQLAAILTAPIPASMGVVPPKEGYLKAMKELADENDILLIFDEVVTGFRVSLGGGQESCRVTPDLCAMAKALGAGFPIAAFGGRTAIMDNIGPGKVVHAGTLNANPLCLAASRIALDELEAGSLKHIHKVGDELLNGIKNIIEDLRVNVLVQGFGSLFSVYFTDLEKIDNYRDFLEVDRTKFAEFARELLRHKVYIWPSAAGHWFVSAAHTEDDSRQALETIEKILKEMRGLP